MKLDEIATVRTGLVTSRKRVSGQENRSYSYKLLNLRCIVEPGYLDLSNAEQYYSSENLKNEYLTQSGDILVRLSAPYTAVMITEEQSGYLIPSHFSIIRVDKQKAIPDYVFWFIKRDSTRKKIAQNNSGSTAFGTISSGFFANLSIRNLPREKQNIVGQLFTLSDKEQELLLKLADEKTVYNKLLIDKIYGNIKRGNK